MTDLAVYLLRSGACLALFLAVYWLALRRETFFALNRAFLLAAGALSLVLPLLRVPSPFIRTLVYASGLPVPVGPAGASSAPAPPGGTGLLEVLTATYAAGAALFLLLFIVRLARLAFLAGRCGCVRHSGLRIVLCGYPGESFSFFRFVFLNSAGIPPADTDRVLAHELAHVRQLHSLDIVLTELLTVVQWFNPFVWPYRRSLRETHEYLADRAVIAQGCSLARYQLLVVEQHVGGRLLELASSFRTSQIKRRLHMMSRQETRGLARWKPLLALPVAVALVLAFAESQTIVAPGPAVAAAAQVRSAQEGAGQSGVAAEKLAQEEQLKALKEKMLRLEEMKQKNAEMTAKLKDKLAATTDAETKAKIESEIRAQKAMALEIGAKERLIQMKALEQALNSEISAEKKAEIEYKLQQLKAEAEDYGRKADQVRKAGEAEKAAAAKKAEKK